MRPVMSVYIQEKCSCPQDWLLSWFLYLDHPGVFRRAFWVRLGCKADDVPGVSLVCSTSIEIEREWFELYLLLTLRYTIFQVHII